MHEPITRTSKDVCLPLHVSRDWAQKLALERESHVPDQEMSSASLIAQQRRSTRTASASRSEETAEDRGERRLKGGRNMRAHGG